MPIHLFQPIAISIHFLQIPIIQGGLNTCKDSLLLSHPFRRFGIMAQIILPFCDIIGKIGSKLRAEGCYNFLIFCAVFSQAQFRRNRHCLSLTLYQQAVLFKFILCHRVHEIPPFCATCTTLYEFIFLKVVHLKALILLGFLRVILICTTCTTKIHPYI
nr:MAG TPA: hypothetical protein [Caudoviricetes sp.]